jgi:hypothetical protein
MNGIIEDLKFKYGEKRWREFTPAQKKKEIAYQRSLIREGREYSAEKKKAQKIRERASNMLKRERKQKQEADKLKRETDYLRIKKAHIVAKRELRQEHPIVKLFNPKPKTVAHRRKRSRVLGRGSGWNL